MNNKIFAELQSLIMQSPQLLDDNSAMEQAVAVTFGVVVDVTADMNLISLTDTIDEAVLSNYFSTVWQPKTKKYKYSGLGIVDEIKALTPEHVLDLGCGYNEFKGKINNLIGVDAYNNRADINCHILDYNPTTKFDAVICLGSINFGTVDKIYNELKKAVSLTKTGGFLFFRANPGRQHDAPESQWIDFFDWNPSFILNVSNQLNCEVVALTEDGGNRLYFVLKAK